MQAKNVSRLVILGSFGIGPDFLPGGFIPFLWGAMLRTFWRRPRDDILAMEKFITEESGLDYVVVST